MRVTSSPASRLRRKRVLKLARGYRANRSKLIRQAYVAVDHAMAHAYIGRKQKTPVSSPVDAAYQRRLPRPRIQVQLAHRRP